MRGVLPLLLVGASALQAQTGIITTIAGTTPPGGVPDRGYSGDNGPATSARLALANVRNECDPAQYEQTSHILVDRDGNVYFADSNNHRIRRIDRQGVITTVAGSGERPAINQLCDATSPVGDGGPATAARLYNPADIVLDRNGNLIIADEINNRIRQVTPGGQISTIVGSGQHQFYAPNVPATTSGMDWPSAVALDPNGVLHFVEIHSNRIARVGPNNILQTIAGTGFPGFAGDGGPAAAARFSKITGLTFDSVGNLYVADQENHRIRRITPDGVINTIAGTSTAGFGGDGGPAAQAMFNRPADVKLDSNGNIYIADMGNHRIRRISPSGTITTVAGDGRPGRGPDNVAATSSSLNFPSAIALDSAGDLYIVDWQNYLIRKVTFSARPTIAPGGVVNGASFAPAPIPVAPGSIISIFGVNLAPGTAQAQGLPLPTELAGSSVRINGVPAPLFFVSPGQINAQLPVNISPGTATAVVQSPSGESAPATFSVESSAVGIFVYPNSNRAIVQHHPDFSLNGPGNPAARGSAIILYLTGQGPVDPPVSSGQAAPDPPSRATGRVTASIDRMPAEVLFLGLTPGFVGLAQANLIVPQNVRTGDDVVLFVSVDNQIGNTATISIR